LGRELISVLLHDFLWHECCLDVGDFVRPKLRARLARLDVSFPVISSFFTILVKSPFLWTLLASPEDPHTIRGHF